jgi:hypothetical protein
MATLDIIVYHSRSIVKQNVILMDKFSGDASLKENSAINESAEGDLGVFFANKKTAGPRMGRLF